MATDLEETIGTKGVKAGLLREFLSKEDFTNTKTLGAYIKKKFHSKELQSKRLV